MPFTSLPKTISKASYAAHRATGRKASMNRSVGAGDATHRKSPMLCTKLHPRRQSACFGLEEILAHECKLRMPSYQRVRRCATALVLNNELHTLNQELTQSHCRQLEISRSASLPCDAFSNTSLEDVPKHTKMPSRKRMHRQNLQKSYALTISMSQQLGSCRIRARRASDAGVLPCGSEVLPLRGVQSCEAKARIRCPQVAQTACPQSEFSESSKHLRPRKDLNFLASTHADIRKQFDIADDARSYTKTEKGASRCRSKANVGKHDSETSVIDEFIVSESRPPPCQLDLLHDLDVGLEHCEERFSGTPPITPRSPAECKKIVPTSAVQSSSQCDTAVLTPRSNPKSDCDGTISYESSFEEESDESTLEDDASGEAPFAFLGRHSSEDSSSQAESDEDLGLANYRDDPSGCSDAVVVSDGLECSLQEKRCRN